MGGLVSRYFTVTASKGVMEPGPWPLQKSLMKSDVPGRVL